MEIGEKTSKVRKLTLGAALCCAVVVPALLPSTAEAWWSRGVWVEPGPVVVAPPVVYARPPVVVARPYAHWVPGHYNRRGFWVPAHWA